MRARAAAVFAVVALAACAATRASPWVAEIELTIYAAASLTGVMEDAARAYETAHPGVTVTVAPDSSTALRTQIEEGAPADLFLSADTKNPQALVDRGLTDGRLVPFAGNRLTIIVPLDNPAGIKTPADLARPGVRIVAAGDEVPITTYAMEAVENLAALPDYPADFAAGYVANVVSREDNVKAVVTKVELGDGEAAIVYVTDATASGEVAAIEIPPEANVLATYAGVVVAGSSQAAEARAFLTWLSGPDGQAILAAGGFASPP